MSGSTYQATYFPTCGCIRWILRSICREQALHGCRQGFPGTTTYTAAKPLMHAPAFIVYILDTPNPFMRKDRLLVDSCPKGSCETRLAKHQEICDLCHKATGLNVTPMENREFPPLVNELTYAQYNALFPTPPGFGRFLSFACLVSAQREMLDYSQVLAWTPRPEALFGGFEVFDDDDMSSEYEEDIFHECVSSAEPELLTGSKLEKGECDDLDLTQTNFEQAYKAELVEELDISNACAEILQESKEGMKEARSSNTLSNLIMALFIPMLTVTVCLQAFVGLFGTTRDLDVVDIIQSLAANVIIFLELVDLSAVVGKLFRAKATTCDWFLPTIAASSVKIERESSEETFWDQF